LITSEKEESDLRMQIKVSKLLSIGFVFSIVWLAGLGSLIALVIGLRARNLIRKAGGRIAGSGVAWWCIIAGGIGVVLLPLIMFQRLLR
jgi:hypothetical protein